MDKEKLTNLPEYKNTIITDHIKEDNFSENKYKNLNEVIIKDKMIIIYKDRIFLFNNNANKYEQKIN